MKAYMNFDMTGYFQPVSTFRPGVLKVHISFLQGSKEVIALFSVRTASVGSLFGAHYHGC